MSGHGEVVGLARSVPTFGAFVVDPGGHTGIAIGRCRDEGTIAERLSRLSHVESFTIGGHWTEQAVELSSLWFRFRAECHRAGLPAYFVYEDFILTRLKSSEREGLYSVWVIAATMGYRMGCRDEYERGGWGPTAPVEATAQQPSQAMTYATDARLKRWGLWQVGAVHERDAWRHFALFVASEKSQRMRAARMRVRT